MRFSWVLIFVLGVITHTVFAAADKNKQELTSIQSKIERLVDSIGQLRKKKLTLQQQLSVIDKRYGHAAFTLITLNRQLQETQLKIHKNRQDIKKEQDKIEQQMNGLEAQFRAAYAMGRREKLKLLLNQQDPAISSRMLVYYDYFNQTRLKRLQEVSASIKVLSGLEQANLLKSRQIQGLQKSAEKEQLELSILQEDRRALLAKLEKRSLSKENQLRNLKENEKKLQLIISSLREQNKNNIVIKEPKKPFSKLKGKLSWPVQGKILKKFGSRRADSRWDGVLIAAGEGKEIQAISAGKVVYADWLRGYGLLVILDHGKGYMTLYAFNQSLFREVGEMVQSGDVIATVGQSGGRTQASLYFGIRKNGKAVDPLKWCRKIHKGETG